MQIKIYEDHRALSVAVADTFIAEIKNNPAAVLCLATGDTPRLSYELLVEKVIEQQADVSRCTFVGLDEWVGISPDNTGTCRHFLETLIFKPLHLPAARIHLFDGRARDLAGECSKMDATIAKAGGIDLLLAGVGINGHIGFNEPGISPRLDAHVINLDEVTQSVGRKYFTEAVKLKQGITLGLQQVLQSRKLILMANGSKKAEVMQKALEEPITGNMPAGIVQKHVNAVVMIDAAAASLLDVQKLAARGSMA